jgi:hypothetical protein
MLTDLNNDDFNDDWETVDIPNLIVSNEKEKKILAERKLVEEADALLTEELFLGKKEFKEDKKEFKEDKKEFKEGKKEDKKEGKKEFKEEIDLLEKEKRKKEHVDRQKNEAQRIKKQKEERMRQKELYGEAKIDEYDEQYGDIEDKY